MTTTVPANSRMELIPTFRLLLAVVFILIPPVYPSV
jgi:hypothetical protein